MTQYLVEEALALRLELSEEAEKAIGEATAEASAAVNRSLERRERMLQGVAG